MLLLFPAILIDSIGLPNKIGEDGGKMEERWGKDGGKMGDDGEWLVELALEL